MFLFVLLSFLLLGTATFVLAEASPLEGYVFAYFTNSTRAGENVFLAASNGNNALNWTELNNDQPILTSTKGTTGLRDPFLMRAHEGDKFFLLATDLSIGSGTSWDDAVRFGSRYIEIWESSDLRNWGEQRHVLVSPPEAGMTWAPEAYYDTDIRAYVVFWSSSLYSKNDPHHTSVTYPRMLYATTTDFINFSATAVWQDAGKSRIDSTVIKSNDVFYRFTKDEGWRGSNCSDIIQERSTDLLGALDLWTTVDTCIGHKAGLGSIEGPTVFKSNPGDANGNKFYLFVDEYSGRGYIPLETADISKPQWKVSASYKLPTSPRHGTVLPVSSAELIGLTSTAESSRAEQNTALRRKLDDTIATRAKDGNPILPGYYADPNIVVFGRTYYIYATTDGFPAWSGKQFFVWKSLDLVNWSRSKAPILTLNTTSGNVPWANGNAWAPTIISCKGIYYFYFSGNNTALNRKTIGVASASSPDGPFTAESSPMIFNNETVRTPQAIDPDAFLDPKTGIYWLIWGSGKPLMAQLSENMLSIKQDTLRAIDGLVDFREGSFVVYRQGLYHFTYSINDTRSVDYRVGYATATEITGPWTYRGVILQKDVAQGVLGTGHNSVLNVPGTDDWYIAYHRFAIPNGNGTFRETCIDRVVFNATTGLMQKVVPTLEGVRPEPVPGR